MKSLPSEYIEVTHIHIQEIVPVKQSYKGLTGGWSKYGGKRIGIGFNQHGLSTVEEEWTCQSCGHSQSPLDSPYLYEYPEGDYLRVCSICLHDECQGLKRRLTDIYE